MAITDWPFVTLSHGKSISSVIGRSPSPMVDMGV